MTGKLVPGIFTEYPGISDPRLDSIHVEAQRRELFRQAREGLLDARGDLTHVSEKVQEPADSRIDSKAIIEKARTRLPPGRHYALVDKESFFPLKWDSNPSGRMTDNACVRPRAYDSRRHCAILVHATNGCDLHDIASKNGTFI